MHVWNNSINKSLIHHYTDALRILAPTRFLNVQLMHICRYFVTISDTTYLIDIITMYYYFKIICKFRGYRFHIVEVNSTFLFNLPSGSQINAINSILRENILKMEHSDGRSHRELRFRLTDENQFTVFPKIYAPCPFSE